VRWDSTAEPILEISKGNFPIEGVRMEKSPGELFRGGDPQAKETRSLVTRSVQGEGGGNRLRVRERIGSSSVRGKRIRSGGEKSFRLKNVLGRGRMGPLCGRPVLRRTRCRHRPRTLSNLGRGVQGVPLASTQFRERERDGARCRGPETEKKYRCVVEGGGESNALGVSTQGFKRERGKKGKGGNGASARPIMILNERIAPRRPLGRVIVRTGPRMEKELRERQGTSGGDLDRTRGAKRSLPVGRGCVGARIDGDTEHPSRKSSEELV